VRLVRRFVADYLRIGVAVAAVLLAEKGIPEGSMLNRVRYVLTQFGLYILLWPFRPGLAIVARSKH
jgi:hypothetical protein